MSNFNKMDIQEQVKFLNAELKKTDISVTKLCKQLGLIKSTVVTKFTRAGYKYNPDTREYMKEIIQNDSNSISQSKVGDKTPHTWVAKHDGVPHNEEGSSSTNVLNNNVENSIVRNDNKSISGVQHNVEGIRHDDENSKDMPLLDKLEKNYGADVPQDIYNLYALTENQIKGIQELLSIKDQLQELIQNNNKHIIDVDLHELKIDKTQFKGDLKGRLVKVYDNVNTSWVKFCKVNSQFKMQDLYSLALLEFMEKYK